jgi:hypothetical protein
MRETLSAERRETGGVMTRGSVVRFADLEGSDLVVDEVYAGGVKGNASDDPIAKLVPVGNQGGFRRATLAGRTTLAVLYTSGAEADWPDRLDRQFGELTYYGDKRRPGGELHATRKGGNALLRDSFEWAGESAGAREQVPPFLAFEKTGRGRDVKFLGLAVPGSQRLPLDESLVAVWRHRTGQRFQNYRSSFTVLDTATVNRKWIEEIVAGEPLGESCPEVWRDWVETGRARALISTPTLNIRKPADQLPTSGGKALIKTITNHFSSEPFGFEACALAIWRLLAPATGQANLTRPWRDGGRDAVGDYLLGPLADQVAVEFALEAKCYALNNGVGVRDTSRLISRLRHRQFGVFVTTSYFAQQAYEEIRADGHPVVMICARDIEDILKQAGIATPAQVEQWLLDLPKHDS